MVSKRKNVHKETFCPQQPLFTQGEFLLRKKRQEERSVGQVELVKGFIPKYLLLYFYSVFSTPDGY